MLKKKWVRVLGLLLVLFCFAQLYRPELVRPRVTGDFDGPLEVKEIFKRSCYNCHSNETQLSWFDQVNPAYLLARQHVVEGRKFLNFSHWDSLTANQKRVKLFDVLNVIKTFRRMPKEEYLLLHPEARLDPAHIAIVEKYVLSLETPVKFNGEHNSLRLPVNAAFRNNTTVKDAPNGISFPSGYRTWTPVSSTGRFDNNTFRIILANPVAERAIRERHNNPYPDGAILAKLVWHQKALSNGTIVPGEFIHVEFMIKDQEQFRATGGWGWARWKGESLTPHGVTPLFVNECVNCHKPVAGTDFVFTNPLVK
jgi:hypothetical protein